MRRVQNSWHFHNLTLQSRAGTIFVWYINSVMPSKSPSSLLYGSIDTWTSLQPLYKDIDTLNNHTWNPLLTGATLEAGRFIMHLTVFHWNITAILPDCDLCSHSFAVVETSSCQSVPEDDDADILQQADLLFEMYIRMEKPHIDIII